MNAGEMYPLFAAMLTQRPWEDVTRKSADHLYIPRGQAERQVLQARARQFVKEINELLSRMPRDLLLLLKTNDCLRSVDLALGQASCSDRCAPSSGVARVQGFRVGSRRLLCARSRSTPLSSQPGSVAGLWRSSAC